MEHVNKLAAMDSSSDEDSSKSDTDSSDIDKEVAKPPRKIRKLRNTSAIRAAISHSGTSSELCDDQSLFGSSNDESGDDREQDVGNNLDMSPSLAEVQVSSYQYVV